MKPKNISIILVIFLLLIPVLSASQEKVIELKLANWSPTEGKEQEICKAGADWIEKRFPGRVKVTIYPAQTLVAAAQMYDGTVSGITDIGYVVPAYTLGRFPKTSVIDLPPYISSSRVATPIYWDFYKKFLADEWKEVKVLSMHLIGTFNLHTKKDPIRTLEDIKGLKIRTYGGISNDMMSAFGGIPVAMPMSEAYEALRQGIVEGIIVPISEMRGYRLIDVTFYHTVGLDVLTSPHFLVMNLKKWNSLPPDIRKAFDEELTPYWNMESAKIWDRWMEMGLELVKKTPGHELIVLPAQERKRWIEKALTVNDLWLAKTKVKGIAAKTLLEEKLKAVSEYTK
jgi:TRAP-type C4-dicarboxylate transport system substrate-binding protein